MTKKVRFLQPFGTVASSHQPRRGIYRDESKVSIRLRLGCSLLPFPVRLVCPILLFNRRGWVRALQPPCAVDRLPCGRSINHYLISTYLPIFQSSLRLAAGCQGWGCPRRCGLQCCRPLAAPLACNDTIMKPNHTALLLHADLSLAGFPRLLLCLTPRRRQLYVFAPGILQQLRWAVKGFDLVWVEVYQSNNAIVVVGGDIPFPRLIPHGGCLNAVFAKHRFNGLDLFVGERLAAVQAQRPGVTVVDAHGFHKLLFGKRHIHRPYLFPTSAETHYLAIACLTHNLPPFRPLQSVQ